jgi:alkylhydroperoxidase family enzyme
VTDTQIDAIAEPDRWADVFDARERAALRLADAMCGATHALDGGLVTELRTQFSEVELAELVLVAGQANLSNRAGNAAKQLLGPSPA